VPFFSFEKVSVSNRHNSFFLFGVLATVHSSRLELDWRSVTYRSKLPWTRSLYFERSNSAFVFVNLDVATD
jgi:hypothetical protein